MPQWAAAPIEIPILDASSVRLFEPVHSKRTTSASEAFTVKKDERGLAREVPTARLDRLLKEAGVSQVDFLSMDIELAEPKALAGLDIASHRPELV